MTELPPSGLLLQRYTNRMEEYPQAPYDDNHAGQCYLPATHEVPIHALPSTIASCISCLRSRL